jgi:Amt family ammonium transporter
MPLLRLLTIVATLVSLQLFTLELPAADELVPAVSNVAADAAVSDATADAVVSVAAEPEAVLSAGDTAWMLTATALVLFMTLPGLALFYGGLVRAKNVLSVLVQCFALAGIMSLLWVVVGYSLAFTNGGSTQAWLGGFSQLFLKDLKVDSMTGSIPESIFVTFQMTFFIITPALIAGAYAERMKFAAMVLFSVLWGLTCYLPICHMAWAGEGALFHTWGVLDFAGGTVVHINAGIAALVACIMIGKRRGYPQEPIKPHNLTMTVTGAALLWVGWFGFNAGSQLAADGTAGMAMLVTQVSAATAAVTWMLIEWVKHGKPSALGLVSGAVGGLVGITPASGTVGVPGALVIGVACGFGCYFGAVTLKHMFKYDDSLDAFGVHGVGGIIGALLTGLFASHQLGGSVDSLFLSGGAIQAALADGSIDAEAAASAGTVAGQVWAQLYYCDRGLVGHFVGHYSVCDR